MLRGAGGDFKVKTGFRFYPGSEDQAIDPLIASVEGIDRTPAFRGLAIAVFEDLQLAEFGNRLPFLTFEIWADEEPTSVGAILQDASDGAVVCDAPATVRGFAAYGGNRRVALAPLVEHLAVPLFDDGTSLRSPDAVAQIVEEIALGCSAHGTVSPKRERAQTAAVDLPRSLSLSYYDPARDYQTGQMRAVAESNVGIEHVDELPAAIDAGQAKALAEGHIARRWAKRDRLVLRLPPPQLSLEPGAFLSVDGSVWQADKVTAEDMVVRVELTPLLETVAFAPADPGTHLPAPDEIASPTALAVLDLPDIGFGKLGVPVIAVAACQPSAGWRPVPIELTVAGETRTIASARSEATVGTTLTVLGSGPSVIFDLLNSVEVELADPNHWLEARDDEALANGANLAALGSEIIQFGGAAPLGRFRLSRLLRGRRGTEWAIDAHALSEPFVLLDSSALQLVELPLEAVGSAIQVKARGLADDEAAWTQVVVQGEGLRPPSPVHLRASRIGDELWVSWVRRSRSSWAWIDGIDAPLGESVERYRVRVEGSAGTLTIETAMRTIVLGSEQLSAVGAGPANLSVVQVGDFAESRPTTIVINQE